MPTSKFLMRLANSARNYKEITKTAMEYQKFDLNWPKFDQNVSLGPGPLDQSKKFLEDAINHIAG